MLELQLEEIRAMLAERAAEEIDTYDDGHSFPYAWQSEQHLREAANVVARVAPAAFTALVCIDASGRNGGLCLVRIAQGDVNISRLEPTVSNSDASRILEHLWYERDVELGMEGVYDLAEPSKNQPLVTGHAKARIAAVGELAKSRSHENLPTLLGALRDPANAGEPWSDVRRAIYRAVSWFEVPDVWDPVLLGLKSEDPETRSTIEYILWRLDGLAKERSFALREARVASQGERH